MGLLVFTWLQALPETKAQIEGRRTHCFQGAEGSGMAMQLAEELSYHVERALVAALSPLQQVAGTFALAMGWHLEGCMELH